jgi:YDG domain
VSLTPGGTHLSATTVNFEITKKGLTISGLTAQNKVYDGNTNATITGTPSLVGVVGTDDVTLAGTATAPSFLMRALVPARPSRSQGSRSLAVLRTTTP